MQALRSALFLLFVSLPALPRAESDWISVLEDSPGRLVLELRPPMPVLRVQSEGLTRPVCPICHMSEVSGGPDLPLYRFDVLSGEAAPRIALHVLESETRVLQGGLASIPFQPTPKRLEYRPDPALFRSAGVLTARTTGLRYLRGAPVRGVEVPLAQWNDDTRTLTAVRRLRVELEFPGVRPRSARAQLPDYLRAAVKNPSGGAWLYDIARPRTARGLRSAALGKVAAGARAEWAGWPGETFIRIKVGDKTVDNVSEDQVYALSFEDLARVSPGIRGGIRVDSLRLYTGANDTLERRMDSLPPKESPHLVPGMLREIPMEVVDDGDGTFDDGDTIRFFAHGTSVWRRIPGDTGTVRYEFSVDPYSYENSYYLGYERQRTRGPALRLPGDPGLQPVPSPLLGTYHYLRAEQDRETAACDPSNAKDEESGFAWFWHWKGNCAVFPDTSVNLGRSLLHSPSADSLVDLIQRDDGDTVFLGFYTYQSNRNVDAFQPFLAGKGRNGGDTLELDSLNWSRGRFFTVAGPWKGQPKLGLDSLRWYGSEKRFEGYTVVYQRRHSLRDGRLWIFPPRTGVRQTYKVEDAEGARCVRVVDGVAERSLVLDSQGRFTDSLPEGADARYYVFRDPGRKEQLSLSEESLPAQGLAVRDLLTGDGENPEYLIITGRPLAAEAAAFREYRKDPARVMPLRTSVVHVEDIYRQFGSGRLSPPAIRDFLRWAYNHWDQDPDRTSALRYVLILGDGHYDYRGIHAPRRNNPPAIVVPPYEFIVPSSGEQIATEDFYGNLDPGDNDVNDALLDIAIGRVPVQTAIEASNYLQKVKAYENPANAGEWRGRVILTADDHYQRGAPNDMDPITPGHTTDSDHLGKAMTAVEPGLSLDRVYLLDYPINSSYRKPQAAQDLLGLMNRGALMTNYVGHGSSNQWADEVLLQTSDALSRLQNRNRAGLLNAFSCTVGRFESLSGEGMSEQFVKLGSVGAIGAVSATRESFPQPNIALALAFYSRLFSRDTASGRTMTAGEALMGAKNSAETSNSYNDMKYALLGEPVLFLRKPALGVAFNQAPDTLRALDCSTLEGTVEGGSGSGFVNVKITAGSQPKVYELPFDMKTQYVEKRGSILFERTVPYRDGRFKTEYFLPRQVPFGDTNATITAFAWDGSQEREGSTVIQGLSINGTAATCPADSNGRGPAIRITGCEGKETGGVDFPDRVRLSMPYCLQIVVEDSVGGVVSAEGPDEGTTVEVPGVLDPFHPQPGIDDLYLKSYQVLLERKVFRPGSHLLKVMAKDGFGNASLRTLRMDLSQDTTIQTITAYNVPNPVKRSGTAFHFSTILPQEDIEVIPGSQPLERLSFEVRIFDQAGRVVRSLRNVRSGVHWDGRDEWGNRAANGVYFYVVTARWDTGDLNTAPSFRTLSTKRNTLVLSR